MQIGVPTELKPQEKRIALVPAGAQRLVEAGHSVLIQEGAGIGSGFADEEYVKVGARIVPDVEAIYSGSEMVLKVKEPQAVEYPLLRKGQVLFTYLHLAAEKELTAALIESGAFCFAYETLEIDGVLPLLTPMSEVAGRLSIQAGAKHLESPLGGKGVLLGGVPGVPPGKVLVLGGGVVGTHAASIACGFGADVTIMDVSLERLRYLDDVMPANCRTVYSSPLTVREHLRDADIVVGAVLIPGATAPRLVTREDLSLMEPGTVIVDVAVDQGGCVETARVTTHAEPTYVVDGIVHYCVGNMPGAVPRTSTRALTNATLPWTLKLADLGPVRACHENPALATAANVLDGAVVCRAVAEAYDMEYVPPTEAVASPV